jgi:hypothetical protein
MKLVCENKTGNKGTTKRKAPDLYGVNTELSKYGGISSKLPSFAKYVLKILFHTQCIA